MHNVTIIGAGLTGLITAYFLNQKGVKCTILESQNRIGGRVHTLEKQNGAPLEMGATWVHPIPEWIDFLKELDVTLFPQDFGTQAWVDYQDKKTPIDIPPQETMYRVAEGTHQIIRKLLNHLPKDTIQLGTQVSQITQQEQSIRIKTNQEDFITDKLIITIPPKLLVNTLHFQPELNINYLQTASECATWMEYSTKFAIRFNNKFCDKRPYTLFSQLGIIQEMYDHSSFDQQHYSLKGFLNSKVLDWTPEQRKKGVIQELKNIYGDLFPSEFEYFDKIWIDDQNVSSRSYDYTPPKQYNSEPVLRNIEWNNSLFFSGTETSPYYAGYMEGAFFSAIKTIKSLHF